MTGQMVENNFKDTMNYQEVHLVLFLFILIFIVGNIVTYMHQPLISLTPAKVTKANKLLYTGNELKFIRLQCQCDQKLRLIDVKVLNWIRSLKIAKRRPGGRRGGIARDASGFHQLGSIIIVLMSTFHDLDYKFTKKLLNIGLGNLRSVKGKEIIL